MNSDFIISLNNVSVTIEGRTILSDITWQLGKGENWAFIGGNGAGKSTLLRLIRGELWPDQGDSGKRIYNLDGNPGESPIGIKKRIALVSAELQDAYHRHQWNISGRDVVYTGFFDSAWLHQEPTEKQKDSTQQLLHELKLDNLAVKNFLEMSRGEARQILIARALIGRPDILALDEPCDGLDASSGSKLLQMAETVASSGIPVLYATHRISEFIPSITHVLIISNGKIVEQGKRNYALKMASLHPAFGQDFTDKPKPAAGRYKRGRLLITIRHSNVFLGRKKILRDISWEMRKGEHWAIIGRNGAGKSTMLKLIAGDIYPALGGEINRSGGKGSKIIRNFRKNTGIVSPELQRDYSYNISGLDVVMSGFFSSIGLYDKITPGQKKKALHWIAFFQLQHLSGKRMSEMSYGEQRKILIARAVVSSPDILILDEPCSGLDQYSRSHFLAFIEQAAQSGVSLIMSTHYMDEIPSSITHMMIIDEGRIIAQGKKRNGADYYKPLPLIQKIKY